MSFRDILAEPSPSPDERPDNHRALLDAYDILSLTRSSEIYLKALEHYIYRSLGDN
ncbi:hypothetical protein Q5692_37225 [Microcoleus sp. C2C3]|uniref:hypothetical protein n=1 Tax=unclassified Microcoleus TaxID=2642155 RepID=UPI002FCF2242